MMKTISKQTVWIAASTLVVGLLLGWLFFGGSGSEMQVQHTHTSESADETVWTCSMHPQIRQPEPGNCPICGMELIPLDGESNSDVDPAAISMSPTAMQLAQVSTAEVSRLKPVKSVRLNGKVQPDERAVYSQSTHIPGRIEKLFVNFTGEYVNKGQVIASIYSPDLVNAQEELFEAKKLVETQPILFQSAKEKLKNWKLTDRQITQILESGVAKEELPIVADISGYVMEKMVNLGDYVNRGMPIYKIANLSNVWVMFDVYESDLQWINKGDKASFSVASVPGEEFEGKITFLDPVINPATRVAKARVEVSNRNLQLKPEMFVSGSVKAKLPYKNDAIAIPKSAVMWTGERSVVYVKTNAPKGISFLMREVKLGPSLGDSYVVLEGLEEGDEIAINGTFSIDAAAQLAGKPSMMNPGGGPAMTGHDHGGSTSTSAAKQSYPTSEVSISQKAKESLKPLVTSYLFMQDALAKDDFQMAQKAGNTLLKNVEGMNMSLFTGSAHDLWMRYESELKNGLQHVQHFKSLEEIRKTFIPVSNAMINLVNTFKPTVGTLYVSHCPMANNNQGADWLSSSKEIRNPYYGDAMLTCGEVTREIK